MQVKGTLYLKYTKMYLYQIILLKTSVIEIKHGYPYRSSDSILIQLLTEF